MSTQISETEVVSKQITYRVKSVYGKDNMYVTSEHLPFIKALTRKETIDGGDIKALEALGFVFNRVF